MTFVGFRRNPGVQGKPRDIAHATVSRLIDGGKITGVALAMKSGTLIHAKGYGNATDEKQTTVETVFHVASVTKQFTAAAVLLLVEKGMVDLDVSVDEYLPRKYQSSKWETVSVHHLLSHSSGITDYALSRDHYDVVDGFCPGDTVDV